MKRLAVLVNSLFIFLGLLVSCQNDIKIGKKAYLTFGDVSRVIQPTELVFNTDEEISFELKGRQEESEFTTLRTWSYDEEKGTAYNQMIQSNIPIELGEWDFELLAIKNDQPFLKGSVVDKNIVIGENILNFGTMEILKEDGLTGSINFKLEFPFDEIKAIKCGLYDLNSNVAIQGYESQCLVISSSDDLKFVCYEKTAVPVGIYFMKFELYSDEDATNRIKVYSPVINIVAGHLTEGEDVLKSINTFYTIEYELNGASWRDGYEPETYFNKNALVYLPSSDDLIYEGYNFLGWYIDDEKIESPYRYSDLENTSSVITLTAHWEEKLSVIYSYELGRQNYASESGASLAEVRQNSEGVVTEYKANVVEPTNSQTVWDYYVQPVNVYFEEGCNYAVSVKLKSKEDTVVGIQAANADMFFTVNGEQEEWTTCTFETGFIEKALSDKKNGITIGFALAEEIYISSLKISPIQGDDNLPTLAFNVTKTGINEYLANEKKAENIIEVAKTSSNAGYNITINTPLASNNYDSTKAYLYNDVTLELRDYAKAKGINKVAFDFQTSDTVYTSIVADTISPNSMAWNNKRQTEESLSTIFPVFEDGEEVTVSIIKISNADVTSQNKTSFSIKNFKIEKEDNETGKYFAIKTPDTTTGGDKYAESQSVPVSEEITIPGKEASKEFDVLMYNKNDSGIDWDEVTRFIYSTEEKPINSLRYYIGDDGKYYIQNTGSSEISCKITLTEDFTVLIEEGTTTGGTTSGGEATSTDLSDKNRGLAYFTKPDGNSGNISCLYIYDAEGLGLYRDLVNGTLTSELTFTKNGYTIASIQPSYTGRVDAYLADDITVSNWVPISKEDVSFFEFDGQGYSITLNSFDSNYDGVYAGVFGKVGNGNAENLVIKNLVVKGQDAGITTSAQYAGGIVAYSYGATISNCVNKLKIDASASSTGYLGGIVGYTKKDTIISSCVNFAELVSTSSIGGIVGFADVEDNYSPLSIDKCINIGSIKGSKTHNFVSGILGRTATATTISNCINFGERGCNGGPVPLNHSGVATVTDSGNLTISNCINAGPYANIYDSASIAIAYGSIIESSYLYYNKDNWYYDNFGSQVQGNVEDTCTVSGLSTEDFFDSSKCVLIDNGNWSCVTDKSRYPLPNLSSVFTDNTIWKEIRYAAKVEVSSGGGEEEIAVVSSFENLKSTIESITDTYTKDNPYVIGIENGFSTEISSPSSIEIKSHIKLIAMNSEGCTITKTNDYASINIFKVNSGASLTLGDENAVGEIIIDGNEIESTKSLINVSGTLVLNKNSILQNSYITSSTHGGAVYSQSGTIEIHGGIVQKNKIKIEKKYGGGIYLDSGNFKMSSGTFSENSCSASSGKVYGGALYLSYCAVEITGGEFSNNIVSESTVSYGGAIYILTSSTDSEAAVISNCTFESNTAYQRGGAIYSGGTGNVEIKNCNFENNNVSNDNAKGGAIYVGNTDGSVSVNGSTFKDNTSPVIYNEQLETGVSVDDEIIAEESVWDPS